MKSKIVKCIDCGKEFPRKELNRMFRCRVCAGKKVRDTAIQLHEHSGPEYEKWLERMRKVGVPRAKAALDAL